MYVLISISMASDVTSQENQWTCYWNTFFYFCFVQTLHFNLVISFLVSISLVSQSKYNFIWRVIRPYHPFLVSIESYFSPFRASFFSRAIWHVLTLDKRKMLIIRELLALACGISICYNMVSVKPGLCSLQLWLFVM